MGEVVLFHHAQGLTDGVRAFAEELGAVRTPDLYDGATFPTLEEGMAHVQGIGFDEIVRRGAEAAVDGAVYIGMSLGVLPAQYLAQTTPARVGAEDLEATAGFEGELFLYPGTTPLFTDRSLPDYVEQATAQVIERVRAFLARV